MSSIEAQLYVNKIAQGFIASNVIFVATKHNLFSYLVEPRYPIDIAKKTGWKQVSTQRMLDALVALKLVKKNDEMYCNSMVATKCLIPEQPGFQGHIINHLYAVSQHWRNLEQVLVSGTGLDIYTSFENKELQDYVLGMDDIAQPILDDVLENLELEKCNTILDLGCGSAAYSIALIRKYPRLKVTLFDRSEVFEILKSTSQIENIKDCCTIRTGNLLHDDIGKNYDCIFASNIIHFYDANTNRNLIKKCFNSLNPNGMLVIKDFILNYDRSGPPYALMFGLHMFICSHEGSTYSDAEIQSWVFDAGFSTSRVIELNPQNKLFIARK